MSQVDDQVGQLGKDAEVPLVLLEELDRALLLTHVVRDCGNENLPSPPILRSGQGCARLDEGPHAGLHVHHRVAVELAAGEAARVGIVVPAEADRLRVDVPGEYERRPRPARVHDTDDVGPVREHVLEVDAVVAHVLHPSSERPGQLALLAHDARNPDDLLRERDGVRSVYSAEHGGNRV